jgi:hypothetical protein
MLMFGRFFLLILILALLVALVIFHVDDVTLPCKKQRSSLTPGHDLSRTACTGHKPETYHARREVASFVDGMLSNFGVCATHENKPAMIIAESANPRRPNAGHFVLLVPSSHDRFERKSPSVAFPKLHLMAAPHGIGDLMRAAYDFSIELGKGAKGRGR